MTISSYEFAVLVNKLHQSPEDGTLKQAVVDDLPKMVMLARGNPVALYHLAHIYSPTSPQYRQSMRQAANLGCTNAMLVMCQLFGKSNNPNELKKAAHYIEMIDKTDDSYIKQQVKSLLKECPQLARVMQEQAQPNLNYTHSNRRFFVVQQERNKEVEFTSSATCNR